MASFKDMSMQQLAHLLEPLGISIESIVPNSASKIPKIVLKCEDDLDIDLEGDEWVKCSWPTIKCLAESLCMHGKRFVKWAPVDGWKPIVMSENPYLGCACLEEMNIRKDLLFENGRR